jgi:hypothetical protein
VSLSRVRNDLNDQAGETVDKESPCTTLARQKVIQKFSIDVCQWHGESSIRVVAASPKRSHEAAGQKPCVRIKTRGAEKHHRNLRFEIP